MNEITLNKEQFEYVLEGWDLHLKTHNFLICVFLEGKQIDESAKVNSINLRYAYRVCKNFKNRMHEKLSEDGLILKVVFESANQTPVV